MELRLSSAYHPQTDGATERANRTMTQMLRQCVAVDQKNWAIKLPAFFLNYGRMPRPLIWNGGSEYPGVFEFAEKMKNAIMHAHDQIIEARVKQTTQANKHRRKAPLETGDLVYLSKFIGPFPITKVVEPGAAYKLELSEDRMTIVGSQVDNGNKYPLWEENRMNGP